MCGRVCVKLAPSTCALKPLALAVECKCSCLITSYITLRSTHVLQGFYDRKKLFWKDIEDTTLCAACAPPGGGRQEMTARFVRHFTMLCVPPPSDTATKTILSAIFNGFLADFPKDFAALSQPIVACSVEAYNRWSTQCSCHHQCA